MTKTRIYVVENKDETHLVEALSAAQAVRHVVRERYSVRIATTKLVAELMQVGIPLESAAQIEAPAKLAKAE